MKSLGLRIGVEPSVPPYMIGIHNTNLGRRLSALSAPEVEWG
jgi:hypothetical protein